jgi:hypothetical protein
MVKKVKEAGSFGWARSVCLLAQASTGAVVPGGSYVGSTDSQQTAPNRRYNDSINHHKKLIIEEMMRKIKSIKICLTATFLMILFTQLSCTRFFRKGTSVRQDIQGIKVIYQDEKVTISFSKQELIQKVIEINRTRTNNPTLKSNLDYLEKQQGDIILPTDVGELYQHVDTLRNTAYLVFNRAHIALLKQGRAQVYNKSRDKKESRIFYYRHRNRLGNVSDFFCFSDGKVFYSDLIAFGE